MVSSFRSAAVAVLAAVAGVVCVVDASLAQTYPSRPVRVIVPQPPGGGTRDGCRSWRSSTSSGA